LRAAAARAASRFARLSLATGLEGWLRPSMLVSAMSRGPSAVSTAKLRRSALAVRRKSGAKWRPRSARAARSRGISFSRTKLEASRSFGVSEA
jgi:hypothetical protein